MKSCDFRYMAIQYNRTKKEVRLMKKQWIQRREMMQYGKDPISRCRDPVL